MFLRQLLEEIDKVDQPAKLFAEEGEASFNHEDFHAVGTVSSDLQKLYTICLKRRQYIQEQGKRRMREAVAGHLSPLSISEVVCDSTKCLAPLNAEAELVYNLFFDSLELEFPELIGKTICINPSWQVGWLESERVEDSNALLYFDMLNLLTRPVR